MRSEMSLHYHSINFNAVQEEGMVNKLIVLGIFNDPEGFLNSPVNVSGIKNYDIMSLIKKNCEGRNRTMTPRVFCNKFNKEKKEVEKKEVLILRDTA